MAYYDGAKLLSMKDINGLDPEIYMLCGNRTGGKTTYFNRLVINHVLNKKWKFLTLFRYQNEMDEFANKFFKDIGKLFFSDYAMESDKMSKGVYQQIYLKHKGDAKLPFIHGGYALSLNSADKIKRFSHLFSDVNEILFDEFQSETGSYLPNEISKFISLHTSIARGNGEMVRRVPVYMLSNSVSIINPYFVQMGISSRIKKDTRFLRGNGYVLEMNYNLDAQKAQEESAFNRAFSGHKYLDMSKDNVYLNDNLTFIEKPAGNSKYICTIRFDGVDFGIRQYAEKGIYHISLSVDYDHPVKIAVGLDDHSSNFMLTSTNALLITRMRIMFNGGCVRFQNQTCKNAFLAFINVY